MTEYFTQETLDRQGNVHSEVLPRSPLHDALLSISYTHQWTSKIGNAYSHAYRHPNDLTLKFDEIKNNLDTILPNYEYWINQNVQGVDVHNYYKGNKLGDAVTTEPNSQGGHYLSHYYDPTMEHA